MEHNDSHKFEAFGGESAYRPDIAAEIDQPEELLAERFGVSLDLAKAIFKWHEATCEQEVGRRAGWVLHKAIVELMQPGRNLAVQVHALAFAAGISCASDLKSMAERAKRLGVTRSNISFFAQKWRRILGIELNIFLRPKSASDNSRKARLKVLYRT